MAINGPALHMTSLRVFNNSTPKACLTISSTVTGKLDRSEWACWQQDISRCEGGRQVSPQPEQNAWVNETTVAKDIVNWNVNQSDEIRGPFRESPAP